jgi:hypothetical protein
MSRDDGRERQKCAEAILREQQRVAAESEASHAQAAKEAEQARVARNKQALILARDAALARRDAAGLPGVQRIEKRELVESVWRGSLAVILE